MLARRSDGDFRVLGQFLKKFDLAIDGTASKTLIVYVMNFSSCIILLGTMLGFIYSMQALSLLLK